MFDPKFNIVAPGADQTIYYPYNSKDKPRLTEYHQEIDELIYGDENEKAVGKLEVNHHDSFLPDLVKLSAYPFNSGEASQHLASPMGMRCALA